eukprot:6188974-Pleurochrysis_carterae.AAC.1
MVLTDGIDTHTDSGLAVDLDDIRIAAEPNAPISPGTGCAAMHTQHLLWRCKSMRCRGVNVSLLNASTADHDDELEKYVETSKDWSAGEAVAVPE